ncbi:MAG TPA: hypothetical protein VM240_04385 [Verrucomicrobiae bacterium]|nr:hypothetical protein [Verrucomicrobiae bacterium]
MTSAALVQFDRQGVFNIVDPACLQLVAGGRQPNDECERFPYENNLGCVPINLACHGITP